MKRVIGWLAKLDPYEFWGSFFVSCLLIPFLAAAIPFALIRATAVVLDMRSVFAIGASASLIGLPGPALCAALLQPRPPMLRTPEPRIFHSLIVLLVVYVLGTLWNAPLRAVIADAIWLPERLLWIMLAGLWGWLTVAFSQSSDEFGAAFAARSARRGTIACLLIGLIWLAIGHAHARALSDTTIVWGWFSFSSALLLWVISVFTAALDRRHRAAWVGRCRACGYSVGQLDPCPECGTPSPLLSDPQLISS